MPTKGVENRTTCVADYQRTIRFENRTVYSFIVVELTSIGLGRIEASQDLITIV